MKYTEYVIKLTCSLFIGSRALLNYFSNFILFVDLEVQEH